MAEEESDGVGRGPKREMNRWLASVDAQSEELEGVAEERVIDPDSNEEIVVTEADPFAAFGN